MKKTVIFLSVVVALVVFPGLVSAQLLPGLPSLPGMPAFNLPSNVSVGNLSLYGAFATNGGSTHYSVSRALPFIGGISQVDWKRDYSSFYVAANLPVSLGDYGAAIFSASWALPASHPCRETGYNPAGIIVSQAIWDVDSYWGTIEGTWAYPLSDNFTALAGFRWKCWQLSYKSIVPEVGLHSVTDTADATYNGYIPFVGLLATYRGMNLGVIGFPTTFGDVDQFEQWIAPAINVKVKGPLGGGYFLEIFGDYAMPMPGSLVSGQDVDLSIFGKCSFLETGGTTTHLWSFFPFEQEWDFRLSRKLFIVGAKATWKFNLAGLLP